MPLSDEIFEALATLSRRAESVSAVMGTANSDNRFTVALEALEKLAQDQSMPIAIVGGLAAIHYGYPAVTEDIDVAIAIEHLEILLDVAPRYGFKVAWRAQSGWHTLTHNDVEINIVPEGGRAKDASPTTIPSPMQLGVPSGIGYASLPRWTELKISSGRQKDRAHVVEVLKKCDSDSIEVIRHHLANVHDNYLQLFEQLATQAEEERQQENKRR